MNHQAVIAVVDPAQHTPELDSFNLISAMAKLPCSYHLPGLYGMDSIHALAVRNRIKGIIVLGSNASVNDRLPWQEPFHRWLLEKMREGIPTFGCCYGHQAIAHIFGGKVGFLFSDQQKLKGFRDVEVLADRRLDLRACKGPLVISHREVVSELPKDLEVWARSPQVAYDGLRHRNLPVWSMQPHPEGTPLFLAAREIPQPETAGDFAFGHSLIASFLRFLESR
jgi:GMP synthase (glutamine-hydrolysing)